MIPRITIKAPQGWGKGWLAAQFAGHIAAWKSGMVEIYDDETSGDRGTPAEVIGRDGKPISAAAQHGRDVVARIVVLKNP